MTAAGKALLVELTRRGVVPHILATHVPDEHGRCRGCVPGDDRLRPQWPCGPQGLAQAAVDAGLLDPPKPRWITP